MDTIIFESATSILNKIKTRQLSCVQVAEQFLAQIERFNPSINAISDLRKREDILAEAQEKDAEIAAGEPLGALHGLPITVKDSFHVKGLITSNGNPQLKSNIATEDAALIQRLQQAGAIIMGKSNLALFALDWQSTNKWFGQSNNPYHTDHVVGGSSGGSAAALAAGFTPLELGTDAGGSIRVPAHFCGVCGLRTTESALPSRGNMETPGSLRIGRYLTCNGPMARNVDDLELMLKVLWSSGQHFSENPPVPLEQFTPPAHSPLRIAYAETLGGVELDQEYRDIYNNFIERIKQQDEMHLSQASPTYNADQLIDLWGKIVGFDFGVALKRIPFKRLIAYLFIRGKYKDKQWAKALSRGAGISPLTYARALEQKDNISDQFSSFFQQFDCWITPVSADAAFKHQSPGVPHMINQKKVPYTRAFIPFNFTTTIPGTPILVIPIGQTKKGLPVGIQIHGQKWHDHKILQIGKRLESLTAGFQVPPALH